MSDTGPRYALVARVLPHDEAKYLAYVRDVYYPGLCTMPGFVSLRVARWRLSQQPNSTLQGDNVEYLRMSTWATREDAEAYYKSPLRDTFGRLLELATVLAYGGADILVDLYNDGRP